MLYAAYNFLNTILISESRLLDCGNKQNKYHFAGCKMRIYEQLLKIP